MIRNIIFDWSGTLVDDLPAVWGSTNHVLRQAGREEISLEKFRAEFCLPFTRFYNRVMPEVPLAQLEIWFHGHFKSNQDSVIELPHARTFLHFCRGHGLRTFLLSTVHEQHYRVQAEVTGLGGFIDRAYVSVVDKKARIHEILTDNQLDPAETLFIGDMQHDIETAQHGGVHSCAVLTGYNKLEQLRASSPDLIVEHLGELRDRLAGSRLAWPPIAGTEPGELKPVITVGALILNESGQVLLVRTHKWSDLWGIPGGKTKWGEDSETALRREIKEETGLDIVDLEFILVQDCIHSPEFYRDAHFVLLNYTALAMGQPKVILNDEAREFTWVSLKEALAMPINEPTRVLLQAVQARSLGVSK